MTAVADAVSVPGSAAAPGLLRLGRDEFEAFYARTTPALHRYVARIAGSTTAADDIVQETYIRLLDGAPLADPQRLAYLYRTATRLVFDRARALARERRRWTWTPWREPAVAPPPGVATDVERLFAQLSLRDRALLWLAHVEGRNHAEIAAALALAPGSVRVLLHRARRRLETLLRQHHIDSGDWR